MAALDVPSHRPFCCRGITEQLRPCVDVRVLWDFVAGAGVPEIRLVEEAFDQSAAGKFVSTDYFNFDLIIDHIYSELWHCYLICY